MTKSQLAALKWIINRGGSGIFNNHHVLLAQGELADVMRSTWNKLRDAGMITIENKRVLVTELGNSTSKDYRGAEASNVDDLE